MDNYVKTIQSINEYENQLRNPVNNFKKLKDLKTDYINHVKCLKTNLENVSIPGKNAELIYKTLDYMLIDADMMLTALNYLSDYDPHLRGSNDQTRS